jgi:hypothetical protein
MLDIEESGETFILQLTYYNEVLNDILEKREYAMVASGALRMRAKRFVISSLQSRGSCTNDG